MPGSAPPPPPPLERGRGRPFCPPACLRFSAPRRYGARQVALGPQNHRSSCLERSSFLDVGGLPKGGEWLERVDGSLDQTSGDVDLRKGQQQLHVGEPSCGQLLERGNLRCGGERLLPVADQEQARY